MRMSDFAGTRFIKVEDVADGPMEAIIADVTMGSFDKPMLTFENGDQLSLGKTNVRTLIDTLGTDDSESWIGHRIEVYQGEVLVKGNKQPCVLVRVIGGERQVVAKPMARTRKNDLDDDIVY
ncbi:hypothetical protein ACVW16_000177 [Bradyrhizobium sp. USDA 4474]